MLVDFHLHSLASDGSHCPESLIYIASAKHISILSLTDHDTILGTEEASTTARKLNISFITGTELEANINPHQYCHILSYNMTNTVSLEKYLNELRNKRIERILSYINMFNELGYPISMEEIDSLTPGRHITESLFIKWFMQYNNSKGEVIFNKYFLPSSKYYIPKTYNYYPEVIRLIHECGGTAILAHPFRLKLSERELTKLILKMKQCGLDGIEAYYGSHSTDQILTCKKIADEFNLIKTGGSDWHGWEDTIPMGISIPDNDLEIFLSKLEKLP